MLLVGAAVVLSLVGGFAMGRRVPVKPATIPGAASTSVRFETAIPEDGWLVLRVPHAEGNIVLDGDMDEPGWIRASARTHAFVGPDGVSSARPYSEARFVWADGLLYVGLYAADEDIHAKSEHDLLAPGDDAFHLVFSDGKIDRVLEINPLGILTDGTRATGTMDALESQTEDVGVLSARRLDLRWESGAHVSHDATGTVNQSSDRDDEWLIEMAIPLEALGLRGERGERLAVTIRRCDTLKSGVTSCGSWGEGKAEDAGIAKKGVLVLE